MAISDSVRRRLVLVDLALPCGRWHAAARMPLFVAIILAAAAVLLQARPANAATIPVTTLTDGAPGSLRDAINTANAASPAPTTITFSIDGAIVLTGSLPAISNTVTIDGSGHAITVSGNNLYRVLYVNAGNFLDLQSITIANSSAIVVNTGARLTANNCVITGNAGNSGGGFSVSAGAALTVDNCLIKDTHAMNYGGGIYVATGATLTVQGSTFQGNSAQSGSGIYAGTGSTVTVNSSTFLSNTAINGGGIYVFTGATVTVINSTFVNNAATLYGGGIENLGGKLTVINSTLSGNSASATKGGGIDTFNVSLTLINTIIADSPSGGDCTWSGTTVTGSRNLIKDSTYACGLSGGANLIGVDPNLGPLAMNGGATLTFALLPGSPAIDAGAGANVGCPAFDQRGHARPVNGQCDIGAVEFATLIVNSLADTDDGACNAANCTLREAINAANGDSGPDTVIFGPGVNGAITLTSSLLQINNTVTIDGGAAGAITISGDNTHQVLYVSTGKSLTLQSITIANGFGAVGGGINNFGTLTITNSTLWGNRANYGGGIYNEPGGTLSVGNSTIVSNSALTDGGGIFNAATLIVTGSTLLSNTASTGNGGGVYNASLLIATNSTFLSNTATSGSGGGIDNEGQLIATNNTIVSNTATSGNGGGIYSNGSLLAATNNTLSGNGATAGGGINNNAGTLILYNNIVANSTAGGDCQGFAAVESSNLFQSTDANACTILNIHPDNLFDVDPLLRPLADNGGRTLTMAPRPGSPAIDAGDNAQCPAFDQRGARRPLGGTCDIGALEFLPPMAYLPIVRK